MSCEKCLSMVVRKEDLVDVEETEVGRELNIAIEEGRKLFRRRAE